MGYRPGTKRGPVSVRPTGPRSGTLARCPAAGTPAPSARSSTDRALDYGSRGWGFESLRARGSSVSARPTNVPTAEFQPGPNGASSAAPLGLRAAAT